ncbi:MAG: uridine kinase [Candidatus Krumholzibacteria bacterium]|nr:uridine kinase [Candidatus Krumholzibacteria bacterium]
MSSKPFMIGIAGGSCSGKTSIARNVAEMAEGRTLVLGLDSYYNDFSGVPEANIEVDVPDALDHRLLVEQLKFLAGGAPVERPDYDFATHSRRKIGRRIEPGDYVIVEGLFALYWPEARELIDLAVFVTIDHDTALARRVERDVRERGRSKSSVVFQYQYKVRPNFERYILPTMNEADLIVDGNDAAEDSAKKIVARFSQKR